MPSDQGHQASSQDAPWSQGLQASELLSLPVASCQPGAEGHAWSKSQARAPLGWPLLGAGCTDSRQKGAGGTRATSQTCACCLRASGDLTP